MQQEKRQPETVTRILTRVRAGQSGATEELFRVVYDELRRLAASHMVSERRDHTLQPTALVHEAFLRLVRNDDARWDNRNHFFVAAAEAMRRILVDHARAHLAAKRGGGQCKWSLEDTPEPAVDQAGDVLAVDAALCDLARVDPRKSRLVELRFFGGLDVDETAAVLGVSPRTVKREWSYAKAWLFREIRRN